jgi:ornithine cyclodeaminase/alanine dehydrogenase-like protein (mu-crystallin family)
MSPLFLTEDDVTGLVSVAETIDVLADAFGHQTSGGATTLPRRRLATDGVFLHILAGAIPGYFGYKTYATGKGKPRFYFYLFDSSTAEMVAVMQADALGQIRTGAATGLATRLLARDEVRVATVFGAGWQAQSQLLAMDSVRTMEKV